MRFHPLIVGLVGLALCAGCRPSPGRIGDPPPQAAAGRYTDKQLYRDIATRVAAGQSYHAAATALQRAHGYPTRPAWTVRLPTLAWGAAWLGWERVRLIAYAVLIAAAAAWFVAVRRMTGPLEGLAAAAACLAAGWPMLGGNPVILHERWAGLFLTLALALRIERREVGAIAATACALALRELALPFALLSLVIDAIERRWRLAAGWLLLMALYGVALAWHWHAVVGYTLPGDLGTQGWGHAIDPAGAVRDIAFTSPLQWAWPWLAVALTILAPLGWAALPRREALFCLALYLGLALMIALFARPDNFYWGGIVQPGWYVGLTLLPRVAARVWRRRRTGARPLARADAPL